VSDNSQQTDQDFLRAADGDSVRRPVHGSHRCAAEAGLLLDLSKVLNRSVL